MAFSALGAVCLCCVLLFYSSALALTHAAAMLPAGWLCCCGFWDVPHCFSKAHIFLYCLMVASLHSATADATHTAEASQASKYEALRLSTLAMNLLGIKWL